MIISPNNPVSFPDVIGNDGLTDYVISFNGRTDNVLLTSADVIGALGFTPSSGTITVGWADVTGKPTTFAPSAHTHVIGDVTGLQAALDGKAVLADITWANVSGKPTTFAPSAHTHVIADVTGLQTALDSKEAVISSGTTSQYWRGDKSWQTLDKSAVGLSNVDNTSDVNKPVSTAVTTALAGKEGTIAGGTTSQYWRGDKSWQTLDKSAVGLGNVDNTSDVNKPVSTATQTALNLKLNSSAASAYGLTLIDDVDAATARTTLGLGYFATGTDAANLTGTVSTSRLSFFDTDGNFRISYNATVTTPTADKITFAPQRIAASGGSMFPVWRGEDGIDQTTQIDIGRNAVAFIQALGGSTTSFTTSGYTALTNVGTSVARTPAATNRLTRCRRVGITTTAATAGLAAGWYNSTAATHNHWTVGGANGAGFRAVFVFGVSDASAIAGAHMFVGMRNAVTLPSATTAPDTLTNQIGVAQVNGSTNLKMVYGGSTAQTAIDLGASFPAADTTALYELVLYARPDDATKVAYRVTNISTGAVASGVLTGTAGTALPSNSTFLGPCIYRANNATALTAAIDISRIKIESDI